MIVADGTTDFSKANGTGAFVREVFEPGVRSVGLKNKNYWKSSGPNVDSFEFFAISDDNARVNALLSGDIHLAASINPRSMRLIESQDGFAFSKTDLRQLHQPQHSAGHGARAEEGLRARHEVPGQPRADPQIGVARPSEIGNDQPVSPANIYYNADLKPKAFDPEKAKFHFEKAGVLGQSDPDDRFRSGERSSIDMAMISRLPARRSA